MPVKYGSLFRNLELLEIIPVNFLANEPDAVTTTATTYLAYTKQDLPYKYTYAVNTAL